MPGSDLIHLLKSPSPERISYGGIASKAGLNLSDGSAIHADSTYRILTVDYLYYRDDYKFYTMDSAPNITSISYSQPLIDWIMSLQSSSMKPLNTFLDDAKRK